MKQGRHYQQGLQAFRFLNAICLLLTLGLILTLPAFHHHHSHRSVKLLSNIAKESIQEDCLVCDFICHQQDEMVDGYTATEPAGKLYFFSPPIVFGHPGYLQPDTPILAGRGPPEYITL